MELPASSTTSFFSEPDTVVKERIFEKSRLTNFIIQFLQFAGILTIVELYHFEKASGISLYSIFILALFALHSFSPLRYRLPLLFAALVLIIVHAFGFIAGGSMFLTGFLFIGVCHLTIRHSFKLGLIALLFFGLAIFRTDIFYFPRVSLVISYLMPMFMFRIVIYLYELKHGLVIKSAWQSIVYFFMLPNIFFLFFPIIDYKNYVRTYYNAPEKDIWQKGIRWMLRGIFHLFAYRLICTYFLNLPSDVHDLPSLAVYILSNYLLIVRLSGIFHFAIGFLCMFGMNLPKVFDNYFIATSFVDLWRRINIYWRDFVLKIFFYPVMFLYKKRIKKWLLPVTMMSVFVITFLLHSYQLFWITGSFHLKLVDLVFWITIGFFITINSMIIERNTLAQRKPRQWPPLLSYLISTLKILGMIAFMATMWSLWNSKTMGSWLFLMSHANILSGLSPLGIVSGIFLIIAGGVILHVVVHLKPVQQLINLNPSQTFFLTAPTIALLLAMQTKPVQMHIPAAAVSLVQVVSDDSPNRKDKADAEAGYYDRIIEGDEDIAIGIGSNGFKKHLRSNPYTVAYYYSNNLLNRRMKPDLKIRGLDHDFITNSYGIRDKQYALEKPDSIFRLALMGGSYEMGSGVSNHRNFEYITEDKLNRNFPPGDYKGIEIWNFAGGGYYLIEHLELLNSEVFKYNPDGVIYFAHSSESKNMIRDLTGVLKRHIPLKYPFLEQIVKLARIKPSSDEAEIKELLNPYMDCILQWSYMEMAAISRKHHATPVWAYLVTTEDAFDRDEYNRLREFAMQAGYVTLDLGDVYGSIPRKQIRISDINTHPNELGQQLIANRFYNELLKHEGRIFRKKRINL